MARIPPAALTSAAAAPAVVLALLAVALGGVVGGLLAVALLLPAVARLLVVPPAGGLAVAGALRAAPITAQKTHRIKTLIYSFTPWAKGGVGGGYLPVEELAAGGWE